MTNYNTLYIYRNKRYASPIMKLMNKPYFWTICSADTKYCKDYRTRMQLKYCKEELEEIGSIKCNSAEDCKKLQLSINMVFKAWTKGGGMKIFLDIPDSQFIGHCSDIARGLVDTNDMLKKYDYNKTKGIVYLAMCANNKLKIGITTNIDKRIEELKHEIRNQALNIIDTFESDDIYADEARLHQLCEEYKANGNSQVKWLQECGNSELFHSCREVIVIWNKYKDNVTE